MELGPQIGANFEATFFISNINLDIFVIWTICVVLCITKRFFLVVMEKTTT